MSGRRAAADIERVIDGKTLRRCLGCSTWMPAERFGSHLTHYGAYLRSRCKTCDALDKRQYRAQKKAATGRAAAVVSEGRRRT